MKLIDRYLLKELAQSWVAVTGVLLLILGSNSVVFILRKAAAGKLPTDVVFPFMITNFVMFSVAVVPFGLYLGVMLGMGRLYKDSEMSAMSACGIGGWTLYRPVFTLSMIAVVVISFLTFIATPWAARLEQKLETEIENRSELSGISAGRFNESRDAESVMFVRDFSEDGQRMEEVFVKGPDPDAKEGVETAQYATQESTEHGQYLVFHHGSRYIGTPGSAAYKVIEFERHGIRLQQVQKEETALIRVGKNVSQLLASTSVKDKAELQWRLSLPFAAILLATVALPLSYTTPRQGRYARLALAILIYVPYWNLITLSKRWMKDEITPEWLGMWWVQVVFFVIALLIYYRHIFTRRMPRLNRQVRA